jgi:hypothetical protein
VIEQGDICQITTSDRILTVLAVQASYITEASPDSEVLCVLLDDPDRLPETILSARVDAYIADVRTITAIRQDRFHEQTGRATADELEVVKSALRALFNLGT